MFLRGKTSRITEISVSACSSITTSPTAISDALAFPRYREGFPNVVLQALAMDMPVKIDFMVASSYGNSTNSCGNVSVKLDVAEELAGRHVILVDDIIDTGLTLEAVCCMLQQHKPASIKTAVMCDKADRRVNGKSADYVGFCIPDEFAVGYGLDYAGNYRNLPYIGVLKPCVYART